MGCPHGPLMSTLTVVALDPVASNPDYYRVLFENDRVRVLEYRDVPGVKTVPHQHPDSVMVTLSAFDRRLGDGERTMDVHIESSQVRWVGAQEHWGENTGDTETHCVFVELKEPSRSGASDVFGPAT